MFVGRWPESPIYRVRVQDIYDGLLFVAETTAARPNHPRRDTLEAAAEQPRNLDFEADATGDVPLGWSTGRWLRDRGYRVDLVGEARQGKRAARLGRDGMLRHGDMPGELFQRISAERFAGASVRVRFTARARAGSDDRVYVFAEVKSERPADRVLRYHRVRSDRWNPYELELPIPEAGQPGLQFGIAVTGEATAWLDALAIISP